VRPLRTEVWEAKEEDAHGHSRPEAVTGRGLPPNVSYERWPPASNPQSTSAPVADGGIWAAASPLRAARPFDPPQTRPGRPTCRRVAAVGISLWQGPCGALPGAVLERVCRHSAASPRGLTHAILNTGRWANQRPHRSGATACCRPTSPPSTLGASIRGPARGAGDQKSGFAGAPRRATLVCQPLWRLRPSDATWKQRLGLITLVSAGMAPARSQLASQSRRGALYKAVGTPPKDLKPSDSSSE